MIIFIVFSYKFNIDFKDQSLSKKVQSDKASPVFPLTVSSDFNLSSSLDNLHSPNAILVRLENHKNLVDKYEF